MAALNHPNILAIHDVGTHEAAPYMVTELLEGESLRERLGSGALPVRKAIETAVQIAQGLAAAHDKGIIHRDLKPGNVFLTKDGHVKILDLGLAKLAAPRNTDELSRATTETEATQAGTVLGTVGYMSPEQMRGQTADHRSDVFSFGCVLYETSGYASDVRVSPKGDLVAFADHPALGDNGGTIAVVDSSGRKRTLSTPQVQILGLAWAPSGKEVWFSGSKVGAAAPLKSVDLSRHERVVARVPGRIVIHDIANDGHALLSHKNDRIVAMAFGPGEPQQITQDSIDHADAHFLPEGKGVVFTGIEPGHKPRIYTQAIGAGGPRAISPEGVRGMVPTADGKYYAYAFSRTLSELYAVDGLR
ncbi:MAG: protein kinase [Acidobacteriia bacterium]|nr:protein kinase [Terriglobia bacterium]